MDLHHPTFKHLHLWPSNFVSSEYARGSKTYKTDDDREDAANISEDTIKFCEAHISMHLQLLQRRQCNETTIEGLPSESHAKC